jgi:hypothetical protein
MNPEEIEPVLNFLREHSELWTAGICELEQLKQIAPAELHWAIDALLKVRKHQAGSENRSERQGSY